MVNLWTLHRGGAKALVRQAQSAQPVQADEALVEEILDYTNSHPYLVHLCHGLFAPDAKDGRVCGLSRKTTWKWTRCWRAFSGWTSTA